MNKIHCFHSPALIFIIFRYRVSPLQTIVGAPGIAKQVTYATNPLVGGHLGYNGVVASSGLGLSASTLHGHPGLVGSGLRYGNRFTKS